MGKVRPPDDDAGGQQDEDQAHDAPEHHFLTGIIFADIRHFMFVALQHFNNPFDPREILFIGNVVMHKTGKHKHQHDENHHPEERVQNPPHLRRTEGFGEPLQRREEQCNPRKRHQEEAYHHRPMAGTVDKFGAQNHLALTHDRSPRLHRHPSLCSAPRPRSGISARQRWR